MGEYRVQNHRGHATTSELKRLRRLAARRLSLNGMARLLDRSPFWVRSWLRRLANGA